MVRPGPKSTLLSLCSVEASPACTHFSYRSSWPPLLPMQVSEADQEFAVAKCSDCQQMLPLTSFYKAPGNTHHRSVYCKVCATRRVRSMMARRPRGALPTHKCCSRCQKTLPADDFYSCSSSATGLHSQCKECYRQTERDRRMQKSKRASPLQKAQG